MNISEKETQQSPNWETIEGESDEGNMVSHTSKKSDKIVREGNLMEEEEPQNTQLSQIAEKQTLAEKVATRQSQRVRDQGMGASR
jgi:hypothetical protein